MAQWFRIAKSRDVSTEPLARQFARVKVNDQMSQNDLVLSHSAVVVFQKVRNTVFITPVSQLSSLTMFVQLKAAPKQIELQKRA